MPPVTYFVRMVAKQGQADRVQELLLQNPRRIEAGEPGNLAFGVHRSTADPNEFWLYETWESDEAVEAHESGEAFLRYKEELRPLVEPDSVLFGNTEPVKVLGYRLVAPGEKTIGQRFIEAFGGRNDALMDDVYDQDVVLYSPLAWPLRGRRAVKQYVEEFHRGYPGLRVALHDEFYSADGSRGCIRFKLHWCNVGPFFGHPPTGDEGTMTETHSIRIRDGKIVEQFVGDNTFQMPYMDLVTWRMDFPRDNPDPNAEILAVTAPAAPGR